MFRFLSGTEGENAVVNSTAYDVWDSEDELTGVLSRKIEGWDWLYL